MNNTQKTIADYLESEKITFVVRYMGETVRDKWQCDAWRVSFTSGKSRFETDYFTGTGLRKPIKGSECREGAKYPKKSTCYRNWAKQYIKPVPPCAADVLYSLIQESSAIDISFDYWCSDYGYDNNSISAFNMYQACCKIAKELQQVFNHAQIEKLRTLLEDY